MTTNAYVNGQGYMYSGATPQSSSDSQLAFPHPILVNTVLTAIPVEPHAVKTAFVAANLLATKGK